MEENNIQNSNEKSFEELLNENLGSQDEDQKGRLVTGMVVRIDKDVVFVDFGLEGAKLNLRYWGVIGGRLSKPTATSYSVSKIPQGAIGTPA